METMEVRIERLASMWVASVHEIGESPETEAWEKLRSWAEIFGLADDLERHPVYGFNNPNPSPGGTGYGYEVWMAVDEGQDPGPEGVVTIKEFPGGRFAVTRCRLFGEPGVMEVWKRLWRWVQASPYRWRATHELEKLCNPDAPEADLELELYLPIEED